MDYCSILSEYGICYEDDILNTDYTNYILIYELPEIYINSSFIFEYVTVYENKKIKLNIIKEDVEKDKKNYKLGDLLKFNDKMLRGVSFKINSIDISDSYKINYDYNVGDYNVPSIEYLRPSLDTNFDKTILKLNIDYNSENQKYKTFFSVLSKYGKIRYYINGVEYLQKSEFEEINGSRNILDDKYIGVNREILNAEKIDLIIDARNDRYIYNIKGDN